jgi:hypothetical protein
MTIFSFCLLDMEKEGREVRVGVSVLVVKVIDGTPHLLLGKRLGKKAHGNYHFNWNIIMPNIVVLLQRMEEVAVVSF